MLNYSSPKKRAHFPRLVGLVFLSIFIIIGLGFKKHEEQPALNCATGSDNKWELGPDL